MIVRIGGKRRIICEEWIGEEKDNSAQGLRGKSRIMVRMIIVRIGEEEDNGED